MNKRTTTYFISGIVAILLGLFTDGYDLIWFLLALFLGYQAGRSVGPQKNKQAD
jgi:hypothetical protein